MKARIRIKEHNCESTHITDQLNLNAQHCYQCDLLFDLHTMWTVYGRAYCECCAKPEIENLDKVKEFMDKARKP